MTFIKATVFDFTLSEHLLPNSIVCHSAQDLGVLDPSLNVGGRGMGRNAITDPKRAGEQRIQSGRSNKLTLYLLKVRDRFLGQPSRSPHFILKASEQSKFTTGYIAYSLHRICPKIPRGELENVDEPLS